LFRQILVSLVVLIIAAAGYVYFVPGADQMVRRLGIDVPFPTSYATTESNTPQAAGKPGGAPARPGAASGGEQTSAAGGRGGGGRGGGFARPTPTVITAAVTTSTINDRLTAIGQGTAVQSVSVTSQATGTLVKVNVRPGDRVKAGDIIAQLDSDAEQIAFDKAQLSAKSAADALARTQTLAKSNNATPVQLSAAQLAADTANLELRNARLALDKRSITTPIDGTVGLFQVTAGNAVSSQTVVTTVDDTSSILVNYWVPERYAPLIKTGMPVSAQAIALPGRAFDGTVSAVDSRVDPASRTLQVQAKIPNVSGTIKAGMSFEVSMAFPGDTYPAVDPLAIQWSSDGSYVWVLTPDSKVKRDKVAIIQRNTDGVLVKGDLKPGEEVVTQGVLQLAEGATVRQLFASSSPDAASGTAPGKPGAAPSPSPPRAATGTAG
jgi:RND family efflux transporter MFP subunit